MGEALTLREVAIVLAGLGVCFAFGFGLGALVQFIADRRERRKWRKASQRIPFITE